jgi:ribosomal protein L30E
VFAVDSMECYTCNENWEQSILDRSKPENANLPLKKYATLKAISIYSFTLSNEELIGESKRDYILEPGIV